MRGLFCFWQPACWCSGVAATGPALLGRHSTALPNPNPRERVFLNERMPRPDQVCHSARLHEAFDRIQHVSQEGSVGGRRRLRARGRIFLVTAGAASPEPFAPPNVPAHTHTHICVYMCIH